MHLVNYYIYTYMWIEN